MIGAPELRAAVNTVIIEEEIVVAMSNEVTSATASAT
jgi:hypothetical protein